MKTLTKENLSQTISQAHCGVAQYLQTFITIVQHIEPKDTGELQIEGAKKESRKVLDIRSHTIIGLCFLQWNFSEINVRLEKLTFFYLHMLLKLQLTTQIRPLKHSYLTKNPSYTQAKPSALLPNCKNAQNALSTLTDKAQLLKEKKNLPKL